jgi:hypothetical protein
VKSVNIDLLATAITALETDYDRLEEHHQIEAAVRERRADFDAALGDHPRKTELLGCIRKGDASKVFEVARAILAEVQPRSVASAS